MNTAAAVFLPTVIATASHTKTTTRSALASIATTDFAAVVAARDTVGVINVESFLDTKAPNAEGIVDLGLMTKMATAIAVLYLVESQGLSLDAIIEE